MTVITARKSLELPRERSPLRPAGGESAGQSWWFCRCVELFGEKTGEKKRPPHPVAVLGMATPDLTASRSVSGHVKLRRGKLRSTYYAKWRDAEGIHHERKLGQAWQDKGAPPSG